MRDSREKLLVRTRNLVEYDEYIQESVNRMQIDFTFDNLSIRYPKKIPLGLFRCLEDWKKMIQQNMVERFDKYLEVELSEKLVDTGQYAGKESVYFARMSQYPNRIRWRSKVFLDVGLPKWIKARVQPWQNLQYGVRGKTAVIACEKIDTENVKRVYLNRCNEKDHLLQEFNDLCTAFYFSWDLLMGSPWISYLLFDRPVPLVTEDWLYIFDDTSDLFTKLNGYQKRAVEECFTEEAITMIQGPPGTGKTRTLAAIAGLFAEQGAGVLCLTKTNVAARRMAESMMEYLSAEMLGLKVSQEFFVEWHEDQYEALRQKNYKVWDYSRQVVCATMGSVIGSLEKVWEGPARDVLLLDEASQIWELDAICFLRKLCCFKRIIIFGDEKQLPPYVAIEVSTHRSLIEALISKGDNAPSQTMLGIQYRMPRVLGDLVSSLFYQSKLESQKQGDRNCHISVHDVKGEAEWRGTSTFNIAEAKRAVELYDEFKSLAHGEDTAEKPYVVILTFYDAQRHKILEMGDDRRVFNVDGFQGQEAPYVILSTAARGEPSGFLCDERRINVAISRAKERLCILGCGKTLMKNRNWARIWTSGESAFLCE